MKNDVLETAETSVEAVAPMETSAETVEVTECTEISFDISTEADSTEVETVTLADIHQVRDDIVHADLFGSFLVCGCIVAAVLFRRK